MRKLQLDELKRLDPESFQRASKLPLVAVLDNIRSKNNIGSVFRTSDAFRLQKIYLCGITATPPHRDIHKTALGATESVAWEYAKDTVEVVKGLKEDGYEVYAVEQCQSSIMLPQFRVEGKKMAVIFGHEVHGVSDEVLKLCHGCLEIPQFGTKHSLNVSVSAGVVIWELFCQMSSRAGISTGR